MTVGFRFTSADLDQLPDIEGVRYEIIDGELYVSKTPHLAHQFAADRVQTALDVWDEREGAGLAVTVPGLVFSEDNDVIPDVVWISKARLAEVLDEKGHLRAAPELIVEVLSPGRVNEIRDHELKRELYARQGVQEYWIVDWQAHAVHVHRRERDDLVLVATLGDGDTLTTPLLPGFSCPVASLWLPV